MARGAKITFVGPIIRPARGKGASFLLVQGAGDSIRLEYPTLKGAHESRKLLLEGPMAHPIASETLLTAIQNALAHAAEGISAGVEPETTEETEAHNGASA